MVTIFGLNPSWLDCSHSPAKSGDIGAGEDFDSFFDKLADHIGKIRCARRILAGINQDKAVCDDVLTENLSPSGAVASLAKVLLFWFRDRNRLVSTYRNTVHT